MNNTNENAAILQRALEIIRDRAKYWENHVDFTRTVCYSSAAAILAYAMEGDWEGLNQFDIYGD